MRRRRMSAVVCAISVHPCPFAFALARTYTAALLLEHADWSARQGEGARATIAARRWCATELAPLVAADAARRAASTGLLWPTTPTNR